MSLDVSCSVVDFSSYDMDVPCFMVIVDEGHDAHAPSRRSAIVPLEVGKYLKAIEVTNINIETPPDLIDYNQARITIEYYIKPLGFKRTMAIVASDNNLQELIDALAEPVQKSQTIYKGDL